MAREDHLYCAFFCEENIWQLAGELESDVDAAEVWMITNADGTVATWAQRAASSPDKPIIWDYHVVLATRSDAGWSVWDFDHAGPFTQSASAWLQASFPVDTETDLAPRFRCIEASDYRRDFSSDRSHMHAPGREDLWMAPPPPWPPIGESRPSVLMDWLDCERDEPGQWRSLDELRRHLHG